MKLRASVHKKDKKVGEGDCLAYCVPSGPVSDEFIVFRLGTLGVHINKEDFVDFARHILNISLYNRDKEKNNVCVLR